VVAQAADYWNHNIHYQPVILNAVPAGCQTALDVGCGDGMLARRLAARCGSVTGIDRNAPMIALARERSDGIANVSFLEADFLTHPFPEASFDFACANTVLHHMDFAAALAKMVRVLRPGGRLAVVGLGKDRPPIDWIIGSAGIPVNYYYKLTREEGNPGAPIMEPDMTWAEVRKTAGQTLPGVRYRRRLLWRYSLVWNKPA
jgi:ubiquinone/menaquinone biosynthesis C-methylase UbiE